MKPGPFYVGQAGPLPGENDFMDRLYAAAVVHALQAASTDMNAFNDTATPAEKLRAMRDMLLNRKLSRFKMSAHKIYFPTLTRTRSTRLTFGTLNRIPTTGSFDGDIFGSKLVGSARISHGDGGAESYCAPRRTVAR